MDFTSTAVVEEPIALGGCGALEVMEERPWRWRVRVRTDGPVLAVLHVPEARGWKAFLDEGRTPIRRANLAAMAVLVPAGEHLIRWEYHPPGLVVGMVLSLAGLVGCLVMGLSGRRGEGKNRKGSRGSGQGWTRAERV